MTIIVIAWNTDGARVFDVTLPEESDPDLSLREIRKAYEKITGGAVSVSLESDYKNWLLSLSL